MEARKAEIYKQAIEMAEKKKCFFIDQLVSFFFFFITSFYEYFPIDSVRMNTINCILDKTKVAVKSVMYNKRFKSDNATLQIALMKLIASEDEAHRLNGTSMKMDSKNTTTIINLGEGKAPK